jgi:hypothetical protein
MLETRLNGRQLFAIIISHSFSEPGMHFFTPGNLSRQLAYMQRPTGREIPPYVHNRNYLQRRIPETGDTILLATGGHGFVGRG